MGLFDQFLNQEQTPEQKAELEKWHEAAKKKAAAALEAREEKFRQAEKEFEDMVNKGVKPTPAQGDGLDVERMLSEQDSQVIGELKPLSFEKSEDSPRSIEIVPDHFSPDALRQEFSPRTTIPPPPMRQLVEQVHPGVKPVVPVVPVVTDASLAALVTAVNNLSRRLDVIEKNQEEIANRTLNALCNSLNQMLGLVRKELLDASPRLVESVSRSFEPALKPVLEALDGLKKKDPEPEPETLESVKEPERELILVPEQAPPKSLGELCFEAYKQVVPFEGQPTQTDYSTVELAYERILKECEYDITRAPDRFLKAIREYANHCIEFELVRSPANFYKWLKETI